MGPHVLIDVASETNRVCSETVVAVVSLILLNVLMKL